MSVWGGFLGWGSALEEKELLFVATAWEFLDHNGDGYDIYILISLKMRWGCFLDGCIVRLEIYR